ncbi:XRE family transcriptional regulator [Sphingomonas sp. MMS24-J13]|uniref:XRE family transcriptional regulator n=1 Tax=Sphingomonas sp. MMS24-J13 TaxID=3238686 RepID=UPI00384EA90E
MICIAISCDVSRMVDDYDLDSAHGRLAWARWRAGYVDKAEFAKVVGVNPTTYRAYENGQNGYAKLAGIFARRLGVSAEWLLNGGDEPDGPIPAKVPPLKRASDLPPTRDASAGETAPIQRLDLSLSMGPGTNIDDYIEIDTVAFDVGWLRSITPSPPSMLRLVSGIGDSMFPTLLDTDVMILDTSQRMLNMQDRIYAISLYGAGALKRLRAVGKNRILVISDNPAVEDQEVDAEDISIAGRLIGAFRRY